MVHSLYPNNTKYNNNYFSDNEASKIKMHYSNNTLSQGTILDLLREKDDFEKGLQIDCERLRGYFPQKYSVKQCEDLLWKILDERKRNSIE